MHHEQGKLYVRGDSKIFRFQNGKTESLFLQRKNPRRIAWTTLYRRQHKKGISEVSLSLTSKIFYVFLLSHISTSTLLQLITHNTPLNFSYISSPPLVPCRQILPFPQLIDCSDRKSPKSAPAALSSNNEVSLAPPST